MKIDFIAETASDEDIVKFKAQGHDAFPVVIVELDDGSVRSWSGFRNEEIKNLAKLSK